MDEYSNHRIIANLKKLAKIIEGYHLEREQNQLKEAGYFNPLHFLKTDENGLSSILAFLLDPKEKHGQQDLFLNSFLKLINKPEYLAYDRAVIRTEMPTSEKRRHDIFIGTNTEEECWGIGLEFNENNTKGAYFGVWAHEDNISDTNYQILSNTFQNMEDYKTSRYWLKSKWCDNNLRDWSAETWKGVLDGSLAEQIFQLLAPIAEIANDNIEKLEF